MKTVSVILPVYNSEKTISKTIESVINQTYKKVELIIVNDGSTDNTKKICTEYEKNNKIIKFYSKENTGVSNTRNIAISKATGEYIMFIDSDDLYSKDYVEKMVTNLEKMSVDLVICGYKRINYEKNTSVSKYMVNKEYNLNNYDELIQDGQKNNLFNQIWNKIFIKKIIDENKILFDEKLSLGEDFRFVLSYLENCNKVYNIDETLYLYTNSVDGLNVKYRKNRLEINLSNLQLLEKYYKKNKSNLAYINKKYIVTILSGIKNICLNPKKEEINEELKKLKKNKLVIEKLNSKNSIKYKFISIVIKYSGILLLKFYGKVLIIFDKYYKKKKLGY